MVFCPNCGKQLNDGVQFCPQCGNSIAPAPQPKAYQVQQQVAHSQPAAQVETLSGGEKLLIVLIWPLGFYYYNKYKMNHFNKADQAITWMKWMVVIFIIFYILNVLSLLLSLMSTTLP